jgi:hypothetical protein
MLMHRYAKYLPGFFVGAVLTFFVAQYLGVFPTQINYCSDQQANHNNCPGHYLVSIPLIWIADHLEAVAAILTAVATAFIARFTWTLWQSSEKMWEATKESADAAKLNAEALIDIERAHLSAVIKSTNIRVALLSVQTNKDETVRPPLPFLQFSLKNLGRTTAIVHEASWQIIQPRRGEKNFSDIMGVIVDPVIDGGNETGLIPCVMSPPFAVADAEDAYSGKRPLYFCGYFDYNTSLNRVYRYRFRYQNVGGDWLLTNYEDYERSKSGSQPVASPNPAP